MITLSSIRSPIVIEDVLTSISVKNAASANSVRVLKELTDTKCPLVNDLVPSEFLPSFVDDVVEYPNLASFPVTGELGKIYIDVATNTDYRWTGSVYVSIGQTPNVISIGETAFPRFDSALVLNSAQITQLTSNTKLLRYDAAQTISIAQRAIVLDNLKAYAPTIFNITVDTTLTVITHGTGKAFIRVNSATPINITIPLGLENPMTIRQVGAGIVTLVADGGLTLNGNLVFSGIYDTKTIMPVSGGSVYDVIGAM